MDIGLDGPEDHAALQKTLANRPDLLRGAELSQEDRKILEEIEGSHPIAEGRR